MSPSAAVARECHGCGLWQVVPGLEPGTRARCGRCGTTLRVHGSDTAAGMIDRGIALAGAALILLAITVSTTLMTVSAGGSTHLADLLAGPRELMLRGMPSLAAAVIFTSMIAPFLKLLGTLYVLLLLKLPSPPRHVRRVFVFVRRLSPWSMSEVLLLGAFVGYVKLQALVTIRAGPALISLLALAFALFWLDATLDPQVVWDRLQGESDDVPASLRARGATALACDDCRLVSVAATQGRAHCPRCGSVLHPRKPDSIARTWALVIAAAVMYVPANYYPVLTVVQTGNGAPSTIIGGVVELIDAHQWPLAGLVFLASIAIPLLKLLGLAAMLICTQAGLAGWLRERTLLFAVIRFIGRWSMIDIFMGSILVALLQFGIIARVTPGFGAVAFAAVVILTMLAAQSFDPRLMWDSAGVQAEYED